MADQRNPYPTVDVLLRVAGGLVLVRRRFEPVGWALPGGFVDTGETVEHAAVREAKEETGLDVRLDELFYVYSDPARDSRRHTMSVIFTATAQGEPHGEDDAAEARVFALESLPAPLCFDHDRIVADYRRYLVTGEKPRPASAG